MQCWNESMELNQMYARFNTFVYVKATGFALG